MRNTDRFFLCNRTLYMDDPREREPRFIQGKTYEMYTETDGYLRLINEQGQKHGLGDGGGMSWRIHFTEVEAKEETPMKTFITINGKDAWVKDYKSMEDARQGAINICDHSREIIVREITQLTDFRTEEHGAIWTVT